MNLTCQKYKSISLSERIRTPVRPICPVELLTAAANREHATPHRFAGKINNKAVSGKQ